MTGRTLLQVCPYNNTILLSFGSLFLFIMALDTTILVPLGNVPKDLFFPEISLATILDYNRLQNHYTILFVRARCKIMNAPKSYEIMSK